MPNHPCPRLLKLALLVSTLAACAALEPQPQAPADSETQLQRADSALASQQPAAAAEALAPLAFRPLNADQRARYQLFMAEVDLQEQKPVPALQALPQAGALRDPVFAARAERDRAQALFAIGDPVGGAQALVLRGRMLIDAAEQGQNRDLLWTLLRGGDLDAATPARLASADPESRGWVELAIIARSVSLDSRDLQAKVDEWRAKYPDHPAESRIATLAQPPAAVAGKRALEKVALLLPLSGPYAAGSEAIRDGFLASYFAAEPPRPEVRVYDSGTTPDALMAAYQRALSDGAEFVVGPLRKEDVAQLASYGRSAVPVLALNYLDPGKPPPFNFYQWGLASEDEARQAAEHAVIEHQFRAVTLVPEGDWGNRVQQAFAARLQALGGTIVASSTYSTGSRDHSEEIRALLLLDASQERHTAVMTVLGGKAEFEPRRRQDIDLVFVAARPDQARLIGPQFRYFRAENLPIYATAAVYDGGPVASDLNGLRFCDMPWMLSAEGPWADVRNQLKELFPARGKETARLSALGLDSYTLVRLIDGGRMAPGTFFPAASGTLALQDNRVISRGLGCAEIKNGALKPLTAAAP